MKKLILLGVSALLTFGASAQSAQHFTGESKIPVMPYQVKQGQVPVWGKSTAGGSRWYSHAAIINELMGGTSSTFDWRLVPIWFDSTVRQNFTTGLGTINYSSAGQVLDPIYFNLNNDPGLFPANTIVFTAGDAYSVDSISFSGAYVKNLGKSANIVDTFILSVSPTSGTGTYPYYYENCTGSTWNIQPSQYIPCSGSDTQVRGFSFLDVDSVNRASAVPGVVLWKVPLFDADRQEDSAGFVNIQTFTYPVMVAGVPGSAAIPAGKGVAVTVTFKSGDVVPIPNVDTFSEYHHFSFYTGEAQGAGVVMPYYYYTNGDRNMSQLMFSTNHADYLPTLFVEAINALTFEKEFHDISAHLVCATCNPLSVTDANAKIVTNSIAFPNPATEEVNISFTTKENTSATVSITNAIGQVVATQAVANVTANVQSKVTFSTSALPTGMYMCTIEANGQRSTNRFVVSH